MHYLTYLLDVYINIQSENGEYIMDYIYGIMFSDGTAKFGRSTDLWKRLYAFDAESKRFGANITFVAFCPVLDGVRAERDLHASAESMLDNKSKESFAASGPADVMEVFNDARYPFVACAMSSDRFGPVLGLNSFSPDPMDFNGEFSGSALGRNGRIRRRILNLIDTYSGPVTDSIIKNRLLNYPLEESLSVVADMIADGEIVLKSSGNGRVMKYVRTGGVKGVK